MKEEDMGTAYSFASVRPKDKNSGRPTGKKSYIVLFRFDDVKTFTKDEKGVEVTAFALQDSKKPIAVYGTNSTISIYDKLEGDDDARGYTHHVEFDSPGSEKEMLEFLNNNANEELGAIVINCAGDECKIAGTPCSPLKMEAADGKDDKEANKHSIKLSNTLRGATIGVISKKLIPATDNEDINTILGLGSGLGA